MRRKKVRRKPLLYSLYKRYRAQGDAAGFVRSVASAYTVATLVRLLESGNRSLRRAATEAVGMLGDFTVNGVLGRRLVDVDRSVRLLAERWIREVWYRDGSTEQQQQLQQIVRHNTTGQPTRALQESNQLIEEAPAYAEVWHQRSIAEYVLRDYARAARDCHQALELNPYHFDAAITMGRSYLELKETRLALEAFRRALRLNPNLDGIRAQVVLLEKSLEGK